MSEQLAKKHGLRRLAMWLLLLSIAAGAVAVAMNAGRLMRLRAVMTLFEPEVIVENFRGMDRIFETSPVRRGGPPHIFPRAEGELPKTFLYRGEEKDVQAFIEETWTSGMVVIHNGAIVSEAYYLGNDENTKWVSWSVAKSFVSALIGIAIEEGHIEDIMDPVTKYVPFLEGSGYEGVPIKHVLQMSSGVRFDETYGDPNSDINRMGRALALNTPLDIFVASLENERPSGTFNHYVSMDTQVLGMVLREATGKSLAELTEEKIWTRIGMESDAYWMVDAAGMELAFGGLNATLRDFAKLGQLYLNQGEWEGEQIVPVRWVRESTTPDAPHLQPGEDNPDSDWFMGYGYQWWIPENPEGDFLAIGVYNQFIYVHSALNVVIAKTSAYPDYNADGDEKERETVELFRAIAHHLAGSGR